MASAWGPYVNTNNFRAGIEVTETSRTDERVNYKIVGKAQSSNGYVSISYGQSTLEYREGSGSWIGLNTTGKNIGLHGVQTVTCQTHNDYWTRQYGKDRKIVIQHWFRSPDSSTSGFSTGSRAQVTITVPARPYQAPAAPSGCTAARNSDSKVTVSWTNGATSTASPRSAVLVERSVDDGAWAQVASLGASDTSYADTSVSANHRYQYRVRSQGGGGTSAYATSGTVYTTPSAPTGCSAARNSDSKVTVTWQRGSNAASTYQQQYVERRVDGGSWAQVAEVAATATSYVDTGVSANHRYEYRVRSHNAAAHSGYSTSGSVYTTPSAPTSCSVERASDSSQRVSWANGANASNTYQSVLVERQTDAGSWVQVASLSGAPTNYTDNSTSAGHRYAYRVRSSNSGGRSGYATSGYVYTTPTAPTGVSAAATGPQSASVSASGTPPWADSYEVQRRSGEGGEWETVATPATLPVEVATTAGVNWFRVRAVKSGLASAWAESEDITTVAQPLAPTVTGLPAVLGLGDEPTVSWAPNHPDGSAQVAAQVEVTAPGGAVTTIDVTGAATTCALGEVDATGQWSARVRTKGAWAEGDGWGAWSSAATAQAYAWPQAAFASPATDGEAVTFLPLEVTWQVTDVTGVASQLLELLDATGATLHSARLGGDARSYELGSATYMLANGSGYELRLTVSAGSTLSATVAREFATDWESPAAPSADLSFDSDLAATLVVAFGQEEGAPDTDHVTVSRVLPDGTEWAFGGDLQSGSAARDPLPPLRTDFSYRVYAHAVSGVTSVTEVPARVDTWDWAYSFGQGAATCVRLSDDQSWSVSPKRGRELYHFADGGESGGLPMAYESDVLDVEGSQSFTLLDEPERARALLAAAREHSVGWVRDPFGGRAYCAVDVSLSGTVAPGVVSVSVSTSELVFEEAISG